MGEPSHEPSPASSPSKTKGKTKGKTKATASPSSPPSKSRFFLAPALLLLAAVAGGALVDKPRESLSLANLMEGVNSFTARHMGGRVLGELPSKYATDLVTVDVRHLVSELKCADDGFQPAVLTPNGRQVSVKVAMDDGVPADQVFFMLNGRNDGVFVSYNGQFECLSKAADLAAGWLGADRDVMANGVRLYNQMGFPVRNAQQLADAERVVHILLDFQAWQWPGIEKGHQYVLEDGVVLTTVALSPKVFDVEYFLTESEASGIMERGMPKLSRSKVDGRNESKVVSKSRTSHTAFLDDDDFTRDFRRRAARVARLPSAVCAERLQLLQYNAGEFYRQHLDTFHSREFVPKRPSDVEFAFASDSYKQWTAWAAQTLQQLEVDGQVDVPADFSSSGALFPTANGGEHAATFERALLGLFHESFYSSNMFQALTDEPWAKTLRSKLDAFDQSVDKESARLMEEVLQERPAYLTHIVKVWEDALGLGQLRYTLPKPPVNSVSHFFNWVRWAKDRVTFLGDDCPPLAQPTGKLYPKYTVEFQETLLEFILDDYSPEFVIRVTNADWYDWMVVNRGRNHVLFKVLQVFPQFAELAIRTWENRVGISSVFRELHYNMPKFVTDHHPQRYVTLFIYLNNQTKIGGETVFPYALDRFSDEEIVRTGMSECSSGLAVPPRGLHASLFYTQTPEGEIDMMSRHGGCPPHEGTKWGSNAFMWDSDADEGADLWTTK